VEGVRMRIAVINYKHCHPEECNFRCIKLCPMVATGKETIKVDEKKGKPVISELLCTGCGICTKKCPFGCIHIINLPEEVGEPVHRFGSNGFALYNLPVPRKGIVGLVGANGVGKTTALKILSSQLSPNLGKNAGWKEVISYFRGHEIQSYLEKLSEGEIKAVYKPQYIDAIPRHLSGSVGEILRKGEENGRLNELVKQLDFEHSMEKDVKALSGGELQVMAVLATLIKDADVYLIDEPSSYLDVRERLKVAKIIRSMEEKHVIVVEHDLVVLDYLSDYIHVLFGEPQAYGVVSSIKGVRVGINEYLRGFLKAENIRFREEIKFQPTSPPIKKKGEIIISYPKLTKTYPRFRLEIEGDELFKSEVRGIIGANATGKTTFMKLLAGVEEPDNCKLETSASIAYKPQYIPVSDKTVESLSIKQELIQHFRLKNLLGYKLEELSGGELQRVALAETLSKDAEIYMLDEPSAYLDVEERLNLARFLKHFAWEKEVTFLIIDHDLMLLEYLSQSLMVFEGKPGKEGRATRSMSMKEGMNKFLSNVGITFRRDPETKRPRANKLGSVLDREQKAKGEYYGM